MAAPSYNHNAGEDLSAHQYRIVKFDGSGDLVKAGAGDSPDFITTDKQDVVGGPVGVFKRGEQGKVQVAAALAKGTRIKPDANGKGVAATANGEQYICILDEASTADLDIVNCHVVAKAFVTVGA